jgi:hypothetical protein
MPKPDKTSLVILERIATALGVPVEQFVTNDLRSETVPRADECLRLWFKIKTPEGRRRALESLRAIGESEA